MFNEYRGLKQEETDHYEDLPCRWEDNTELDCRDIGWDSIGWIDLTQDRDQWRVLVNTIMNLWDL
jgi:hypothetical protein